MITISNSQRDYLVKYIDVMCAALTGNKDNKSYNTIRMARKLRKQLASKQPLTADDLSRLGKLITYNRSNQKN